jgi:tetratricopeptide (TPR) repeat protein
VDTAGFQPAVREVVVRELDAARKNPQSAEASARLGMALHAHEQYTAAVICYRRAHLLDSNKFAYLYYEGSALSADGKHSDAVRPLEQALALDSSSIPARLKLGDALLAAGRLSEARQQYKAVIRQDPGVATAHYGLGRTLDGEDAVRAFQKALELFPQYGAAQFALAAAFRKAGNPAAAEQTLAGYELNRRTIPALDDPLLDAVLSMNVAATGLLRQAQALERQGRLEEAAALCEQAVGQMPKLDQGWINLVSLYGRLGQKEKLERAYQQAITLAPNRPDAYYNYGVFSLQSGRVEEARKAFEQAIAVDPRNAESLHNLGSIVERAGSLNRAAGYYQRAIAVQPGFRQARFHLGRIYANQRKYSEAIAEFERSLDPHDEQTATILYALAATHARAGHRTQAIEWMQKAKTEASGRGQTELVASIERDLRKLGVAK